MSRVSDQSKAPTLVSLTATFSNVEDEGGVYNEGCLRLDEILDIITVVRVLLATPTVVSVVTRTITFLIKVRRKSGAKQSRAPQKRLISTVGACHQLAAGLVRVRVRGLRA